MLAHNSENWEQVVEQMEKSLSDYFVQDERCRVNCEDDVDFQGDHRHHFSGLIAGMVILF